MPTNKKEIKINPELFIPSGARKYNARRTAKAAQHGGSLKTDSIKKALLRKIKSKRGDQDTNSSTTQEPEIYSDDVLNKSLKYLDDLSKRRGNIAIAPNQIYVNLDLPPEIHPTPPQGGGATTRVSSQDPIIAPPPPYGCLKGGNKSTYRQWKQTQKNTDVLQSGGHDRETIQIFPNAVDNNIPQQNPVNNSVRQEKLKAAQKLHKSKQVVEKQYATFGKQKGGKNKHRTGKIRVLIKDNITLKKIEHEKNMLDKQNISEARKYLMRHGFLKVGSSAPDDVLREMYRNAFLAGDIYNKSTDVLLHNYMAK